MVLSAVGPGTGQPADVSDQEAGVARSDGAQPSSLEERDQVALDGDSWVTWRVTVPKNETIIYRYEVERQDSLITVAADWIIYADPFELSSAFVVSTSQRERQVQHVQAAHEDAPIISHEANGTQEGSWSTWGLITALRDLELHIVMLAASDGHLQGEFTLAGTAGVVVHGQSSGRAFFATETDFTGGVNVVVDDWVLGQHVQGKFIRDAALEMTIEDRLFGMFKGDVDDGTLQMGYDHPFGSQACPAYHFFPYTCFLNGRQPGDYRFRIDENIDPWPPEPVHSELHGPPEETRLHMVWLLAADVELQ